MARSVHFNEQILSGGIYGQLICHLNPTCLCQLVRREVHKCSAVAVPRAGLYPFLHALVQPGTGHVKKDPVCKRPWWITYRFFISADMLSVHGANCQDCFLCSLSHHLWVWCCLKTLYFCGIGKVKLLDWWGNIPSVETVLDDNIHS